MTHSHEDRMVLTILEDGTARLEVDGVSGANHAKAEQLVGIFSKLLGGPLKVSKRPQAGENQHHNEQEHEHHGH